MAVNHHKLHAIMISVPYQGHINPFVNLALKIASNGIVVTFVHLEFVHHRLSNTHHGSTSTEADLFSEARESGLDIRYATISDGLPLEFDRDLHYMDFWNSLFQNFPGLVDEFVGKTIQSADPCLIHFLVADTVYSWPAKVAQKHNLVNVSFWTEPALVFSLAYHWDILREKGHVPYKDDREVDINYVPGVQSVSTRDLMSYLTEDNAILSESLTVAFAGVKKADFILHNTVHELEFEVLSALNSCQPNYAIRPINFSQGLPTLTVGKSLWSESDCSLWLGSKSPGSVLYVSFGSIVQVAKEVIDEIAYGLLLSEVNFIWVVRAGTVSPGETNALPDGYEDEIKDKGLIIPWCNQIMVLSNPAVGGFLTHNGWNSTVESMWCGVPMLCYPITYDQPTNRKLVVDDWKNGVNLCDGPSVDRQEVAQKIKSFMSGALSKSLRHEASRMKETLRKALEIDGSSERNFDQFIRDLKAKFTSQLRE